MTAIPFFQVDAFAAAPLTGNPAAVMPLDSWLDDDLLQRIAAENNLSETAFTIPSQRADCDFDLRWFTPAAEVAMCGHATLAAGHVLMRGDSIAFSTHSGILSVERRGDRLELDLPAATLDEIDDCEMCAALGLEPRPVWLASDCNDAAIVELADEDEVLAVAPDFARLRETRRMAIVTARGTRTAIASRVFVPYLGIDEDPATGSAHAALVPYWSGRLGSESFEAFQASRRGGFFDCRLDGRRVRLGGLCHGVIEGQFRI